MLSRNGTTGGVTAKIAQAAEYGRSALCAVSARGKMHEERSTTKNYLTARRAFLPFFLLFLLLAEAAVLNTAVKREDGRHISTF